MFLTGGMKQLKDTMMDRKKFLKNGLIGLGAMFALPSVMASCLKDSSSSAKEGAKVITKDCDLSPRETAGPFPHINPSDLAMQNIIGNRAGVPMLIKFIVQDKRNSCRPLSGVFVDLWHCDAKGYYSQYGRTSLQYDDYRNENFLRGRQTTDVKGEVSFISIFPGWYSGRAPHLHLEVLDAKGNSLRVTQVAFPSDVYESVYVSKDYKGSPNTPNSRDGVFSNSLAGNMVDSVTGNTTDGYTILKTIVV